jgi:hypothetical protein
MHVQVICAVPSELTAWAPPEGLTKKDSVVGEQCELGEQVRPSGS